VVSLGLVLAAARWGVAGMVVHLRGGSVPVLGHAGLAARHLARAARGRST